MKHRIAELLVTYRAMRDRARSKIRRDCLDNVIEDLESILREAQ